MRFFFFFLKDFEKYNRKYPDIVFSVFINLSFFLRFGFA